MELDPFSGGQLGDAIFDTNGDGVIDSNDIPLAGIESEEGIIQAPKILDDDSDVNPDNTVTQKKIFSGSTGNLMFQDEKGGDLSTKGRQSWRQIR